MSRGALVGAGALGSGAAAAVQFGFANLDVILSGLIPLAYRIAPRVAWIPAGALNDAVLLLSGLVVVYAAYQFTENALDRFA